MITKQEINALELSPTKKDFVQIWNELLEVASKLAARWDPTSTNESDPGIVLLKAVTGIADKLNYNIDKNTLEAFMPTAAQEDSMRKLCEMLGYSMKYYRSATTTVNLSYYNPDIDSQIVNWDEALLPKFTVLTNVDGDVNYFTCNENPLPLAANNPKIFNIPCMEGQLVQFESLLDNNVVTVNQISENNRLYLPESQIAENGIFIYNVSYDELTSQLITGTKWEAVDNLNLYPAKDRIFKFGYDSFESRPYIEFPEDFKELFNDGIFVYYTRTNGANGNIAAHTLTQIELPTGEPWSSLNAEHFTVDNAFTTQSGSNPESIKQAYQGFKKTIGTFNTLVTCRDYMNYIYSMLNYNTNTPLVSNILITDIRNDINNAVTICSCDESGIYYKDESLSTRKQVDTVLEDMRPVFIRAQGQETGEWRLGNEEGLKLTNKSSLFILHSDFNDSEPPVYSEPTNFNLSADGEVSTAKDGLGRCVYTIKQDDKTFITCLPAERTIEIGQKVLDHFKLVFYPFKSYSQITGLGKDIKAAYENSFSYSKSIVSQIEKQLDADKVRTIAHDVITPNRQNDLISINNYLRLNAVITTNTKLSALEGEALIEKIKIALANAFNLRELDFGEDIPVESILSVIEQADNRIRMVSINDPALYTTFTVLSDAANGETQEYAVASRWLDEERVESIENLDLEHFDISDARKIYNKLAVRNVLAGRIPLFNYSKTFEASFAESPVFLTVTDNDATVERKQVKFDSTEDAFYVGIPQPDGGMTKKELKTIKQVSGIVDSGSENSMTQELNVQNNVISGIPYVSQAGNKVLLPITTIEPVCEVKLPESGTSFASASTETSSSSSEIGLNNKGLELLAGEYIKFRAPQFKTIQTYPAYVNYHLQLNKSALAARGASATTILDQLSADLPSWSPSTKTRWDHLFTALQSIKKTTHRTLNISGLTPTEEKLSLTVSVEADSRDKVEDTVETAFKYSGCLKLCSETAITPSASDSTKYEFTPKIVYKQSQEPITSIPLKIELSTPYLTDLATVTQLETAVQERLQAYAASPSTDIATLPLEDWQVILEYEYIPFTAQTLTSWETLFKSQSSRFCSYDACVEFGTVFWRSYTGTSYPLGRYIFGQNNAKLMPFTPNYFTSLPQDNYLSGIYLAEELGCDSIAAYVENEEEYQLGVDEYLYIEYTPSSTNEDGTKTEAAPVKKIYGKGTIIRPTGFEVGLADSVDYMQGHTAFKTVSFEVSPGEFKDILMHRFGANEQVEIRDFDRVQLSATAFNGKGEGVYVYKNFDCPALESLSDANTAYYVLKDGEYVCYTDSNKSEFAYFGSGTAVTLKHTTIPKFKQKSSVFDIIDNGIDSVPWQFYSFPSGSNKSITFSTYQYFTLGEGDVLTDLSLDPSLLTDTVDILKSGNWYPVQSASYIAAGNVSENTTATGIELPNMRLLMDPDTNEPLVKSWEVTCACELNTSPTEYQVFRTSSSGIKTTLNVIADADNNTLNESRKATLEFNSAASGNSGRLFALKTNLNCNNASNKIQISDFKDVKETGFVFKVFTPDKPGIVRTHKGSILPYDEDNTFDFWQNIESISNKGYLSPWNKVGLDALQLQNSKSDSENNENESEKAKYEKALRLPICLIPNTYGLFTIHLSYSTQSANNKTWIELPIGVEYGKEIEIFNKSADDITIENPDDNLVQKLYLAPGNNCIRITKDIPLFIKSSGNQGILSFDDLRLVQTETLQIATTKDEEQSVRPVLQESLGLNLSQLGYLPITDGQSGNGITVADIINAETESTKKELKTLSSEIKAIQTPIDTVLEDFVTRYTSELKEELTAARESQSLDNYKTTKDQIELAKQLQKDLEILDKLTPIANKIAVQSDHSTLDTALLIAVDAMKNKATAQVNKLSVEDLEESFKNAVNNSLAGELSPTKALIENAMQSIRNEWLKQYKQGFSDEIAKKLTEIDSSINDTNKTYLADLTSNSVLAKNDIIELQHLCEKLNRCLDMSEIESLLATLYINNDTRTYHTVYSDIVKLKSLVQERLGQPLITELQDTLNTNTLASTINLAADIENINVLLNKFNEVVDDVLSELLSAGSFFVSAETDKEYPESQKTNIHKINAAVHWLFGKPIPKYTGYELVENTAGDEICVKKINSSTANVPLIAYMPLATVNSVKNLIKDLTTIITNNGQTSTNLTTLLSTLLGKDDSQVNYLATELTAAQEVYNEQYLNISKLPPLTEEASNTDDSNKTWAECIANFDSKQYFLNSLQKIWPETLKQLLADNFSSILKHCKTTLFEDPIESNKFNFTNSDINTFVTEKIFLNGILTDADLNSLVELAENYITARIRAKNLVAPLKDLLLQNLPSLESHKSISISDIADLIDKYIDIKGELSSETSTAEGILAAFEQLLAVSLKTSQFLTDGQLLLETYENLLLPKTTAYLKALPITDNTKWVTEIINMIINSENDTIMTNTDSLLAGPTSDNWLESIKTLFTTTDSESAKYATPLIILYVCHEIQQNIQEFEDDQKGFSIPSPWDSETNIDQTDTEVTYFGSSLDGYNTPQEIQDFYIAHYEALARFEKLLSSKSDTSSITTNDESVLKRQTELQLLAEIRELDPDYSFYYTAPLEETSLIHLDGQVDAEKSLLNPAAFYDVNNVNNAFVVSKIDIDYLDKGIQIARTSKVSSTGGY